eukprot:scaffold15387_cov80-Skeletonema_menzelii.AAC.5
MSSALTSPHRDHSFLVIPISSPTVTLHHSFKLRVFVAPSYSVSLAIMNFGALSRSSRSPSPARPPSPGGGDAVVDDLVARAARLTAGIVDSAPAATASASLPGSVATPLGDNVGTPFSLSGAEDGGK